MIRVIRAIALAAAGLGSVAPGAAWTQAFPTKPVRMIVSFAPGGGIDIIARLLHHFRGVPLGQTMLIVNGAVLALAALFFGIEPVLYALIVTFVAARVVDVVQGEAAYGRAAIIISAQAADIRSKILLDLERGVTVLAGRGGYTEAGVEVLYCVVTRSEVSILKRLVQSIDPQAFVVISEASEVLGQGFKELPVK